MKSTLPSHLWIARYCERAMQLRTDLSRPAAVRRGIAAYPYASDMAPERAAELYISLSDLRQGAVHWPQKSVTSLERRTK